MKRKIVYSNEPLGDIKVVPDFLPPPMTREAVLEALKTPPPGGD